MDERQDALDRSDRAALERYYELLTPEERRKRIILEPAYRELYNEVTQAHRSIDQPAYFWERWVPVLGPIASVLYMKLRQLCYGLPDALRKPDVQALETLRVCWPRQEELARGIGIKDRGTISRTIEILEEHGLIKREESYRTDPRTGRPSRGSDRYLVYYELPLRPQEAAQLLILHAQRTPLELQLHVGEKPTDETGPPKDAPRVSPDPPMGTTGGGPTYPPISPLHVLERPADGSIGGKKQQHGQGPGHEPHMREKPAARCAGKTRSEMCGKNPQQVLNVNEKKRSTLLSGKNQQMDPEAIEDLAFELADELQDPGSLRFFRIVARHLPEPRVRMLLSETRSARAEGRITKSAGAYFTSACKQLAQELGIDLGLGARAGGAEA